MMYRRKEVFKGTTGCCPEHTAAESAVRELIIATLPLDDVRAQYGGIGQSQPSDSTFSFSAPSHTSTNKVTKMGTLPDT